MKFSILSTISSDSVSSELELCSRHRKLIGLVSVAWWATENGLV